MSNNEREETKKNQPKTKKHTEDSFHRFCDVSGNAKGENRVHISSKTKEVTEISLRQTISKPITTNTTTASIVVTASIIIDRTIVGWVFRARAETETKEHFMFSAVSHWIIM